MINLLLTFALLFSFAQKPAMQKTGTDTHQLYKGQLATIHVDKTLYESKNPNYFYLRFELRNISDKTIGIDLQDSWKVFYPNQWGVYDTTFRMIINERRIIPDSLDEERQAKLIADFKDKKLHKVKSGESFIYYTEFNANGRKKVDRSEGKYLIISIDGQLFMTDGELCERPSGSEPPGILGELVIKFPPAWDKIADKKHILHRN